MFFTSAPSFYVNQLNGISESLAKSCFFDSLCVILGSEILFALAVLAALPFFCLRGFGAAVSLARISFA